MGSVRRTTNSLARSSGRARKDEGRCRSCCGMPARQHNLNATDAAILALFLRYLGALQTGSHGCLLVAADQRLVQAARAEGLLVLNPEVLPAADVPALLASL